MTVIPKAEVKKHLKKGLTYKQIGKIYNVCELTIYRRLKKWGLNKNKPLPKNEILDLVNAGYTLKEIASVYNTTSSSLSRNLKKWGIKLNTKVDLINKLSKYNFKISSLWSYDLKRLRKLERSVRG